MPLNRFGGLRWLRVALAVLTLLAIGWQLAIHVSLGANVLNFFSYFTNLSNLLAAVVLCMLAGSQPGRGLTPWLTRVRALSVVNMVVVGLVFAVLLRNLDLGALRPWVNFVLHQLMPVAMVVDWLLDPPPQQTRQLRARDVLWCLPFPAAYLVWSLARGASVQWYPYPFLNPAQPGGYATVALYGVGIALTFALVALLLFAAARARTRGRSSLQESLT